MSVFVFLLSFYFIFIVLNILACAANLALRVCRRGGRGIDTFPVLEKLVQVVGGAHQGALGLDVAKSVVGESTEAKVSFDEGEDGFDEVAAFFSSPWTGIGQSALGVLSCLLLHLVKHGVKLLFIVAICCRLAGDKDTGVLIGHRLPIVGKGVSVLFLARHDTRIFITWVQVRLVFFFQAVQCAAHFLAQRLTLSQFLG